MTQMDLLVTNVAELLATAVHEVLRLMGQAVSEYRDESARIRQENQKLQHALEELQKRLQISDSVQQVSSSVAAEEPLYKTQVSDRRSAREPVETDENEDSDPYEPPFKEEKPNTQHFKAETREPSNGVSSPGDFHHKRRRSFSSCSASPDVTGAPEILSAIKTESDCPERPQTEDTTVTDTHLHLPHHPVYMFSHISTDTALPQEENTGSYGGGAVRRDNPHACHVCGKSFATSSSLGAHYICHSGERPFACEHCKFRFSRLADLKKHERIHTGEKPYGCTLCGRRFNRTENLRRHLRKVHHGALI